MVRGAGEWQVGELGASWLGKWYWVRGWEVFRDLSCLEIPRLGALDRAEQGRGGLSAPCRGRPWGAGGARAARLQRRGVSASERGGAGGECGGPAAPPAEAAAALAPPSPAPLRLGLQLRAFGRLAAAPCRPPRSRRSPPLAPRRSRDPGLPPRSTSTSLAPTRLRLTHLIPPAALSRSDAR